MFIPNFLLKKDNDKCTEIPNETIERHQTIAKHYYNCQKQFAKIPSEELEKRVIDWLFSHKEENLSSIFCLDNNFTTRFVYYLFKKTAGNQVPIFKINKDNFNLRLFNGKTYERSGNLYDYRPYMPNIYYDYDKQGLEKHNQTKKDNIEDEIEFILSVDPNVEGFYNGLKDNIFILGNAKHNNNTHNNAGEVYKYEPDNINLLSIIILKEILHFSLYIFNDAINFSNDFLKEKEKVKDILNMFSFNECFRSIPKCHMFEFDKTKVYNLDLPSWYKYDKAYPLIFILIGIIEQTIMVRFVISQTKNIEINYEISNILVNAKLSDFYLKRIQIINYLQTKYPEDRADKIYEVSL